MKKTTILALETSCDETGVAALQKEGNIVTVLAQVLASQVDIHALTGGVIPEVAAREHIRVIGPLVKKVLKESRIASPDSQLTAVAVTVGPGLMPALAVGVQAARTLAFAWQKPVIPVHHIEGHIYSALLDAAGQNLRTAHYQLPAADAFPALALIVSGGHTMLILMRDHLHYDVIGQTRDDAAGEAFDKVARLLNLPYPGGPHLSRLAKQGNKEAFYFPRPMVNSGDFDFSFSGLKTAVLYKLRDEPVARPADVAASFERAVVDILVAKTQRAVERYKPRTLLLAGGVAANKPLRRHLRSMANAIHIKLQIAPLNLCGDNAIMIGQVALLAYENGREQSWQTIDAQARPPLAS